MAKNASFEAQISLPQKTGEYTVIIAKGKSFDTNKYATISLIGSNTISFPSLPTENYKISPKILQSDSIHSIKLPDNISAEMTLRQGNIKVKIEGKALIFPRTL